MDTELTYGDPHYWDELDEWIHRRLVADYVRAMKWMLSQNLRRVTPARKELMLACVAEYVQEGSPEIDKLAAKIRSILK